MSDPSPSIASPPDGQADLEPVRRWVREGVVDANDGIIATAGIVEGFVGAGATGTAVLIAAFSAMIAGGISVGGAKYSEAAAERDARMALIEAERRQLELSPAEEFAELVTLYEAKGLSASLAHEVAAELTERDALAAHVDAEYGLSMTDGRSPALLASVVAGFSFAAGAAIPLITVIVAPDAWRIPVTFIAIIVSLIITSLIVAVAGRLAVIRTILRTVAIGTSAMLLTLFVGSLFRP
ncbi:MAG TPA: VIT1/CCC1 transporter family protein [Candidatus Nanopelagicales bacterium]